MKNRLVSDQTFSHGPDLLNLCYPRFTHDNWLNIFEQPIRLLKPAFLGSINLCPKLS